MSDLGWDFPAFAEGFCPRCRTELRRHRDHGYCPSCTYCWTSDAPDHLRMFLHGDSADVPR